VRLRRLDLFDLEGEPHAAFDPGRQRGDDSGDLDIAALVGEAELIGKSQLRAPGGVGVSQQRGRKAGGDPCRHDSHRRSTEAANQHRGAAQRQRGGRNGADRVR
jgi:hypothetical protein